MTSPAVGDARAEPRASVILALLVGSAFGMILNETVMTVALPSIIADLAISVSTAQWLTSGFLLTMAVVIPITGFLLQRFRPRQVYLTSMALFTAGTLICGLAPGFLVLMAGRIVQAGGTAVMVPLLMTSIMRLIPAEKRGQTMGTITIVIAVAPALGPTLSGVVLSTLGWRGLFWVVLPLAIVALAAGIRWMHVAAEVRPVPLDLLSVGLAVVGFGGLVYGLTSVGEAARGPVAVSPLWPTAIAVAALVVFVTRQLHLQKDGNALLDLRPLAHGSFAISVVLVVLSMMSLFGVLILLPLYLQEVMEVSAFWTGIALLPGGLTMGLLGPVVGRLYDRLGARRLVIPGAVVLAAALWAFAALDPESPIWMVVVMHVVLVLGISMMLTPLMTDALGRLPRHLDSHGSAIVTTLQQVAGAAGTALFVTVMALAAVEPGAGTDAAGAHTAFVVAALIATVALPCTLLVGRKAPAPA